MHNNAGHMDVYQIHLYTLLSGGDDPNGMDNTWKVTKTRQKDVQQKCSTASSFKENSQRRQDDGNDDFTNVSASHVNDDGK